jgi:peroxiredoxin
MKDRTAAHPHRQPQRQTRAQRRAAELAQRRQHKKQQRRFSTNALVGGIVTTLMVIAIAIYVYVQTTSNGRLKGLADPTTLNPATALLGTGMKAPDFTLTDTTGRTYHLAAQRGHPVLLEFFAVWCPVCHAEAPTLSKITRIYESHGVRVWSVLSNPYGPSYETSSRSNLTLAQAADLQWFAQTYNVRHPQLIDPNFATVNRYGIGSYPGLYLVDKSGVIRLAHDGSLNYGVLSHALDRALR